MRRNHLQHLRKHFGVARAQVAALEVAVVALHIADQAARFGDQQASGGDVPGLEGGFKEAVVAPGSGVGQVQCGGAGAAQAGGLLHHVAHDGHVGIEVFETGVGEAGADQAIGQFSTFAHAQATVVEVGAAAAGGGEQFVLRRVVYHRLGQYALVLQGDGYGVLRIAMQEVGGAIERIDNPDVFGVALGAALFC